MAGKSTDTSWPILSSKFIPKEPLVISDVAAAYSVYLPITTFTENARTFSDVNMDDKSRRPVIAMTWLQLWLFCLDVFQRRIDKGCNQFDKYPVTVVLEKVFAKEESEGEGKKIVGYAFHIFQTAVEDTLSLANIFADAATCDKAVDNKTGLFVSKSPQAANAMTTNGDQSHASNVVGHGTGANGQAMRTSLMKEAGAMDVPPLFIMYKLVNGRQIFSQFIDAYLGQLLLTRDPKNLTDDKMVNAQLFDFERHFRLRPTCTCKEQKTFAKYQTYRKAASYTFKDTDTFYILPPHFWRVNFVITRMLPHVQFNLHHIKFAARMLRYARAVDAKVAAKLAASMKLSRHAREEKAEEDKRPPAAPGEEELEDYFGHLLNSDVKARAGPDGNDVALNPNVWDDLDKTVGAITRPSDEWVSNTVDFWGFLTAASKNDGAVDEDEVSEIDDSVTRLMNLMALDTRIIDAMHVLPADATEKEREANKDRIRDDKRELRNVVFAKYIRDCTAAKSNVSKAQRILNEEFDEKKLKNIVAFKMPLFDPGLVPWQQYMVYLTEGFTRYCDVATSSRHILFGYIMASGRFVIANKLHPNIIFSGEGGEGKSHLISVITENICEKSVVAVLRKSRHADSCNSADYDVLEVNDDLSLDDLNNNDGRLAQEKSIATNCTNTGVRLMAVKKADGTQVFKPKPYKNTIIRTTIAALNANAASLLKMAVSEHTSILAYLTRLIFIDCPRINSHRTIPGARAQGAAKRPQDRARDDVFIGQNVGLHCILGHAWKMHYIGLLRLDMTLFEPIYTQFEEILKNMAVKLHSEQARVHEQAKIFASCLPFITAFVDTHLVPTGRHYGKPFEYIQMMDWVPVLTLDHIIFTFSFFLPQYYPEAMDTVLSSLRQLMTESLTAKDDRVTYPRKHNSLADIANYTIMSEKRRHLDKLQTIAEYNMQQRLKTFENSVQPGPKPANFFGGAFMTSRVNAGGGGSSSNNNNNNNNKRDRDDDDDDDDDEEKDEDRPKDASDADADKNGTTEKISATYVTFNYSLVDLERQLRAMTVDKSIEHSSNAINTCLHSLQKASITSRPYFVMDPHQVTPLLDSADLSVRKRQGLTIHDSQRSLQIHFGLLNRHKEFDSILERVLKTYAHKFIIPHKALTAMPVEEHPWLLQTINLQRNPDKTMRMLNYSYICRGSYVITQGTDEISKVASPQSRFMLQEFGVCDEDTFALLTYFENNEVANNIPWKVILKIFHWRSIMTTTQDIVQHRVITGDTSATDGCQVAFIDYPVDLINEHNRLQAVSKRVHSAIDEGDGENVKPVKMPRIDEKVKQLAIGLEFARRKDEDDYDDNEPDAGEDDDDDVGDIVVVDDNNNSNNNTDADKKRHMKRLFRERFNYSNEIDVATAAPKNLKEMRAMGRVFQANPDDMAARGAASEGVTRMLTVREATNSAFDVLHVGIDAKELMEEDTSALGVPDRKPVVRDDDAQKAVLDAQEDYERRMAAEERPRKHRKIHVEPAGRDQDRAEEDENDDDDDDDDERQPRRRRGGAEDADDDDNDNKSKDSGSFEHVLDARVVDDVFIPIPYSF